MDAASRQCKECGGSEWKKVWGETYPEHRRERNRTVKELYVCAECGAEGKRFEHRAGGPDIFSGAMG